MALGHEDYAGKLAQWLLNVTEADWHEAVMDKCRRERRVDEFDRHQALQSQLRHQAQRLSRELMDVYRPRYLAELAEAVQSEFVRAPSHEQRDAIMMFLRGEADRSSRNQAS